jgi:hypothetical protein
MIERAVQEDGMKRKLFVALVAAAALSGYRAYAHHSFAATYLDTHTKIEGDLAQFMFRNPHSFVHVLVPDGDQQVRWAVEWSAGGQLNRQGVTRDTLKPGDHVIITGNPGRNPADHRLRMTSIFRPKDGWKWSGVVE